MQRIDKTLPDAGTAPYEVITRTHFYYAVHAVANTDKSVTMTDWYEHVKDKWVFHKGSETIPPMLYPQIKRR